MTAKRLFFFAIVVFFFALALGVTVALPAHAEEGIGILTQPEGARITYGGEYVLRCEGTSSFGEVAYSWFKDGDLVGTGSTFSVTAVAQTGNYFCRLTDEGGNEVDTQTVSVVVGPRRLNITIDDKEVTFGEEEAPLTYTRTSSLVAGDSDEDIAPYIELYREEGNTVGEYAISGVSACKNYSVVFTPGVYQVKKREIFVDIASLSVYYGDPERSILYQTQGTLAPGDTEEDLHLSFTREAGVDAGSYAIVGDYDNDSYEVTFSQAVYKILPKRVQVRVVGLDDCVYDGTAPQAQIELIAPPAGVTLTPTVRFDREYDGAGEYVANISFDNGNYEPYVTDYPFSVAKAPLAVRLADAYVGQNARFLPTFLYDGFVNGEDETVLVEKPQVSANTARLGKSEVTPYGASAKNYEITYRAGVVQVDKTEGETDFGSVVGLFDPAGPVGVEEGGEGKDGLLAYKVFSCTVLGKADGKYVATVYGVNRYPKIFLRASVVDEEGNRYAAESFSYDEEGNLVFVSDHAGTFVMYYDLIPIVAILAGVFVLVVILLIVRGKDRKKYKTIKARQDIAHAYAKSLSQEYYDE